MKILIVLYGLLLLRIYGVSGAETDAVESVSVMEGDSVTLHAVEAKAEDMKVWTFGPDETIIVRNSEIKMFKDRLLVDQSTGSLTIKNITAHFSGIYKSEIVKKYLYKKFNVTVYARLPVPVIRRDSSHCSSSSSSQQNCSLVCSVVNVSHVTLSWYKGNSLLSSINASDLSISLSLPLEVEYQDKNTLRCVLNNPISNQTQHLDISKLCQPCAAQQLSIGAIVGICVGLLLLLVAGGAVVYCCYKKLAKSNENDQTPTGQDIPLNNGQVLREEADNPNNDQEMPDQEKDLPDGQEERDPLIDDEKIPDQQRDLPDGQEECDPLQDMFHSEPDQVKKIKVKQGENVILKSGVAEIQRDDRLRWKYADSRVSESTTLYTVIAVCNKWDDRFAVKDGPGGKFKDRLQLDHQTGNLTVKNMRVKDSGLFKVEIKSNTNPLTRTIKVNVRAPTNMDWDDPNDLSLIPEEDPNNTTTYTVEPTDTEEELSVINGGEQQQKIT